MRSLDSAFHALANGKKSHTNHNPKRERGEKRNPRSARFRFRLFCSCRSPLLIALWALACVASAGAAQPGKQSAEQATVKVTQDGVVQESTVRYLLFLPEKYDQQKKPWPLLLFLHGSGERGDDLDLVKVHGPAKIVEAKPNFPFVVVSPQCDAGKRWEAEPLAALVDRVADDYRVDKRRIYVTGLSMGGHGTWNLVALDPARFAAAAPLCGTEESDLTDQWKKLPIWAFYGAKDRAERVERCREMVAAIKAAGGDAKLTIYPDLGHNCWDVTYANPEFYKWLLSHQVREKTQ